MVGALPIRLYLHDTLGFRGSVFSGSLEEGHGGGWWPVQLGVGYVEERCHAEPRPVCWRYLFKRCSRRCGAGCGDAAIPLSKTRVQSIAWRNGLAEKEAAKWMWE